MNPMDGALNPSQIHALRQTQAMLAVDGLTLNKFGMDQVIRMLRNEITREEYQQLLREEYKPDEEEEEIELPSDSGIPANKFDCHNGEELLNIATLSAAGNLAHLIYNPIEGNYDFQHLKDIHRFIFGDVFYSAGKPRDFDIDDSGKYSPAASIETDAEEIFAGFLSSCEDANTNKFKFAEALATQYIKMYSLSPFVTGNDFARREFLRTLCLNFGYIFDFTETYYLELMQTDELDFEEGDDRKLFDIFQKCIISPPTMATSKL
ncbi:MAG: Fic family protein [Eubacterium sp.]|nr:Fic family protein [Eubacterium sp.]